MKIKINKLLLILIPLIIILSLSKTYQVRAQGNKLDIHLFYSVTCPHCAKEEEFLSQLVQKYPNLVLHKYEVTGNKENLKLFMQVGKSFNDNSGRVPFLVIGENKVVGYYSDETHGNQIENLILDEIQKVMLGTHKDPVKQIVDNTNPTNNSQQTPTQTQNNPEDFIISLPIVGKVNIQSISLPALTVILGILDGFNPCAMWTLLFLISLLIGMQDRKRMWLLGSTYIFTSAFVYFLFMAAWLNLFLVIGYAKIVQILIGLASLTAGGYFLYDFIKNKDGGCMTEGDEKRKKTFDKISQVIKQKSLILSLVGIGLLGMAVNLVELLCSAGLPAIFTKTLTMSQMPSFNYYLYLILYMLFYMLDDMIVFAIAMFTMQTFGIQQKYSRYSHLIGGILVLLIGLAMIFKPELLAFKF